MNGIPIASKKITRGLPKVRRYADDRAILTNKININKKTFLILPF
jgi:hypothetical protein